MRNLEVFFLALFESVFFFGIIVLEDAILICTLLLFQKKLAVFRSPVTSFNIGAVLEFIEGDYSECSFFLL